MRVFQFAAIQSARTPWLGWLSLILIMLANTPSGHAQDSILLNRQAAHKSREYLSIDVQPLFRTGVEITPTTDRSVMKKLNTPGFSAGVDYSRISQSGFTFAAGVHFRMIPVSYKFEIDYNDFPAGGPSTDDFGKKNSNLGNGHLYFPIQAGYTFPKKIGNPIAIGWQPSIMAGISLSRSQQYSMSSGSSYYDESHVHHRIQNITAYYPEYNPWLSYTINVRASKTLKRGNQIFFGVNANFSGVTYIDGQYNLYPNSGIQTGTFRETGSYIALQFGFSFVRKYKEPEKFNRR